ncbi:TetR/AcrR family transcriptional regulator [Devosia sp.]|uniref:TetR/AcrR family transcriptional regulator n=1 Tax=Devosia sp. TaxID=1871048 RepID=UPI0035B303B4
MPFPRIVRPRVTTREALLDAAQRLFAAVGYDATSVNRIIAEVGVSKGAFYHHFDSKEALLEALAGRFAAQTARAARGILEDPTLDAFARLTSFLASMRRHKLETAAEMRAAFEPLFRAENLQLHARTQRAVAEVVRPVLTRIIAEGVAERAFDTPDPESAAEIILHLMTSNRDLVIALYRTRDRIEFERLGRHLMRKLDYLGTVVDRLLGLPEGSIELADDAALRHFARALDGPPTAA